MFDLDRIGAGLPVAGDIDAIRKAISTGAAVVQAPPGTGKTTLVPPLVATMVEGKVLVVAPRRVAVRAAARRLIALSGMDAAVGFSVRGEHKKGSRVEFMTPGVLLRRLIADPELDGVDAVIVDEIHERSLDTDIVLGMLAELRELRDDLTLVAMSATVDADSFAQLLGAEISTTTAPIHPLEITYAPAIGRVSLDNSFIDHLVSCTLEHVGEHSALVFVPSVRSVDRVVAALEARTHLPVFPLHGSLSSASQDAALTFHGQRIVVATAIAESSITVPGVRVVVDAGLSRVPKRDNTRGMTGLVTVSTAKSSADQRAGRAGREGPGTVVRCYSQTDYQHFQPHITSEILHADLTQAALMVAAWGGDFSTFPLLTPAPAPALAHAHATLHTLGALEDGAITELGTKLVTIPTNPRLARALLLAGRGAAPTIAALAENIRGDVGKAITRLRGNARYEREITRLEKLAPAEGAFAPTPGTVIGLAWPDNIAKKQGDGLYHLAGGTRAECRDLHDAWIAVADITLSAGGRAHINAAASIDESIALEILGTTHTTEATFTDGKLKAVRTTRAGAITLNTTPVTVSGNEARAAVTEAIRHHGLALFNPTPEATNFLARLHLLHENLGAPWPDVSSADPQLFLGPEIDQIAGGTNPTKIDILPALNRLLPWPEATRLEDLAPSTLAVPSGRNAPIDYTADRPTVHIKLQECFGLTHSPTIFGTPILFHLLSPAGRPLAVTDDLASFWAGPYQGVRADMRGRYPKHPWPEDPTTAQATAKTNNALQR